MRHTPFLRDLGSGNGFMLPAQVFYYSGRRSFLYTETDHSKLDPPVDFMSKSQVRRLQRLTDSKSRIASSRKVRAIRWVHVEDISTSIGTSGSSRPATTGDAYPRANKIHNTEKSGYGLLLRSVPSTKPGGRSTMLSRMDGSVSRSAAAGTGIETEGDDGGFVATEWEPQFEAGVHFFLNTETGECRETLPPVRARPPPQPQPQPQTVTPRGAKPEPRRMSSMRPGTAPACMEGPPVQQQQQAASLLSSWEDRGMWSSLRLKELRDELAMGTGAKVYDASELEQLLEYLESSSSSSGGPKPAARLHGPRATVKATA